MLWRVTLERYGFSGFADRAAPQLVRWEAPYGWTVHGYGQVADKERTLASVLFEMLPAPESWLEFADRYLAALDDHGDTGGDLRVSYSSPSSKRSRPARELAEWTGW